MSSSEKLQLWGGRFQSGPSATFEAFSGSLHFDKRLVDCDIRGSQAFARALERVGILTGDEREKLVTSFDQMRLEAKEAAFYEGAADEDVHTLVIRKLKEKTAGLADKIHTGRSRNEQVSLDTRLWLRETIDETRTLLREFLRELLALAKRHAESVIPGYTHMRRAQPVLWAHYCLAYFEMFLRDDERLAQARARVNLCPLGSGALAGSGFPFDREAIARDLGFDGITRNSMDVSGDRDWALDYLYAASTLMLHLSRLAEDWILYSSDEFGWLELGDGVTSGSSLMPQKKNPDSLELIRGKSGRVFGNLTSLYVTVKGTPMTYNRDMQEDKEPLFIAADQCNGALAMIAEVTRTVVLKPEVPAEAAEVSWAVATDIAEALARAGTPFHQAHKLAGKLVLHSLQAGKKPADWTPEALASFSPEFQPAMAALMNPKEGMKSRQVPGGTAPEQVRQALAAAEQRLAALEP
ncbi:MAG: argininosuccinate lyase [Acidobacteria bacterium]|nr:argininosuccinate lyase [Acidobacteriota bacterium]